MDLCRVFWFVTRKVCERSNCNQAKILVASIKFVSQLLQIGAKDHYLFMRVRFQGASRSEDYMYLNIILGHTVLFSSITFTEEQGWTYACR